MPKLLRRPSTPNGLCHHITPENAGWSYVGFSLYKLNKGDTVSEQTGDNEAILVLVEGKADIQTPGQNWGTLGDRLQVWEKTPPHALYVPKNETWTSTARTECTLAVCSAPSKGNHQAQRLGPEGISLDTRGKSSNTRYIHNIAMEERDVASSLLVTEVFTPNGHWSSYPSHRHDEDNFPDITALEETYYFRIAPHNGFGIQRVYTEDESLNETMTVRDNDVVLVPKGHHPCAAPYGFEMYYLNVMAGPLRKWRFKPDPALKWIMERDA